MVWRKYYRKNKYSNETYGGYISITVPTGQVQKSTSIVVPPVTTQGTRKIKYFSFRAVLHHNDPDATVKSNYAWVLVFVPENTQPMNLNLLNAAVSAQSLYEPNQNVIASGFLQEDQITNIKTKLSRNLNSGDSIQLIMVNCNTNADAQMTDTVHFSLNYSASY